MAGPFWASWGNLEAKVTSLKVAVAGLSIAVIALSIALVGALRRPPSVVVLPDAREMQIVRGQELSPRHVKELARGFILTFGNWTYETVEDAYREASKLMSPTIVAEFDLKRREKIEEVRRNQSAEAFAVKKETVTEYRDGRYMVRFEGERVVYVGRSVYSRKPYFYAVTLGRRARDLVNPLGVEVVGITQGEMS